MWEAAFVWKNQARELLHVHLPAHLAVTINGSSELKALARRESSSVLTLFRPFLRLPYIRTRPYSGVPARGLSSLLEPNPRDTPRRVEPDFYLDPVHR